jgi:hypothetical protein
MRSTILVLVVSINEKHFSRYWDPKKSAKGKSDMFTLKQDLVAIRSTGIKKVIVCLNKIDQCADPEEMEGAEQYIQVLTRPYLEKIGFIHIVYVPMCALTPETGVICQPIESRVSLSRAIQDIFASFDLSLSEKTFDISKEKIPVERPMSPRSIQSQWIKMKCAVRFTSEKHTILTAGVSFF